MPCSPTTNTKPIKVGGHSTWQKAVALAREASVKVPVLFHHDPRRSDDELDEIGMAADAAYPGTLVASEGMLLKP
ncbi:hypothetical protein [uncultured Roseibium sp.]|uniref:hypothetical protein n=1 Tax=uncultured Roseibium sp. TaxID=1936171 RepID=UPI00321763CE